MYFNKQNIEEQILLYIDGELDVEAANKLLAYIDAHPQYKVLLEAYQSSILEPDTQLIYPDKSSLLRFDEAPLNTPTTIMRRWYIPAAAAAILVLVISMALVLSSQKDHQQAIIAKSNIVIPRPASEQLNPTKSGQGTTNHTSNNDKLNKQPKQNAAPKASIKSYSNQATAAPHIDKEQLHLSPMTTQQAKTQPLSLPVATPLEGANIAQIQPTTIPTDSKKRLPEWLPITEERVEVWNELMAQVVNVKDKVVTSAKSLRNKDIALRIGDVEIELGRKNHN
jgi:hypothetical protein